MLAQLRLALRPAVACPRLDCPHKLALPVHCARARPAAAVHGAEVRESDSVAEARAGLRRTNLIVALMALSVPNWDGIVIAGASDLYNGVAGACVFYQAMK